jgi:hypothetical protein
MRIGAKLVILTVPLLCGAALASTQTAGKPSAALVAEGSRVPEDAVARRYKEAARHQRRAAPTSQFLVQDIPVLNLERRPGMHLESQ